MSTNDFDETVIGKGGALAPGDTWQVVVVTATATATYRLPSFGEIMIGRMAKGAIPIDDDSLSRFHAILRMSNAPTLEDLGSANGSTLEGVRIRPGRPVEVSPGQVMKLGNVVLILQRTRPP